MKGYIYLEKQIQDHWTYQDKPFNKSMAWIDLLLLADYQDHVSNWRGKPTEFKRGDVNRSITFLAERWGWSRDKTRRFLRVLESDGMLAINATSNRTTLTIVNYGFYQRRNTTDNTPDNTTVDTTVDTPGKTDLIKNNKKQVRRKKKDLAPDFDFSEEEMARHDPKDEAYWREALRREREGTLYE